LGNLFWVLAYDTEYAMVDRDDDLKIGINTSAITLGTWDVSVVLLCYLLFLAIWTAALVQQVSATMIWLASGLALAQVAWHYTLIRKRSRDGCFQAFRLNHWLGLTVFAGIVLAYAGR